MAKAVAACRAERDLLRRRNETLLAQVESLRTRLKVVQAHSGEGR